jgi:hypothetical protein
MPRYSNGQMVEYKPVGGTLLPLSHNRLPQLPHDGTTS